MADDKEALEGMMGQLPAEPVEDLENPNGDPAETPPDRSLDANPELVQVAGDLFGQVSLIASWRFGVSPLDDRERDALAIPTAKLLNYYGAALEGPAGAWIALVITGIGIGSGRVAEYAMIKQREQEAALAEQTADPEPGPQPYPETGAPPPPPDPEPVEKKQTRKPARKRSQAAK